MIGEGKSFTQIYDLLGLSIPPMVIVVHVYDVWICSNSAKIEARFRALWEVIVKVAVHALSKAMR